MRLDAHQHFWSYDAAQYPWIPLGSPLHRSWLPADLAALQAPLGFEGSIAVQARQSLTESEWLLSLAEQAPAIKGVVGWVDLRSDRVGESLERLAAHPKFVGVRHVAQDEPNDFFAGQDFRRGLAQLQAHDLSYDLLIYPQQLPATIDLVESFPDQRFVLDHVAKPLIKAGDFEPWAADLRRLARLPHVHCKISGLLTEADHQLWQPTDFTRYLDLAWEVFGPRRLMYGSDWPVCLLAGSYERAYRLIADYAAPRSADEQADLFGGNCAKFYL